MAIHCPRKICASSDKQIREYEYEQACEARGSGGWRIVAEPPGRRKRPTARQLDDASYLSVRYAPTEKDGAGIFETTPDFREVVLDTCSKLGMLWKLQRAETLDSVGIFGL